MFRLAWSERRGKDYHDRNLRRAAGTGRRLRRAAWAELADAVHGTAATPWHSAPGNDVFRKTYRGGNGGVVPEFLPAQPGSSGDSAAGATRGKARRARGQTFWRSEAAPGPGLRARGRARIFISGRVHHRTRSASAAPAMGSDQRAKKQRPHHFADHALHG